MGVPDFLIIDPSLPTLPLALRSEVYPGFGAFLRHRLNTPGESYLAFCAGDFMFDHQNTDALAFHWHERGVSLSVCGAAWAVSRALPWPSRRSPSLPASRPTSVTGFAHRPD